MTILFRHISNFVEKTFNLKELYNYKLENWYYGID